MRLMNMFLAAGAAAVALTTAAPVAAQYYPPSYPGYPPAVPTPPYGGGYGGYGGYGYAPNGYDQGYITNNCVRAVQARLNGNYGYQSYGYGYGRGRVLGITRVEPRESGKGWRVWGAASAGYSAGADITWSCRTDFRGVVVDVDLKRGFYGNNYTPWGDNYEPYGYRRY